MNPISLKFMIEKREGHGEDSDPLAIIKDDFYAVGVFDGMGGSGAAICNSEFGNEHTKAYVASRIIHEAIYNYIENAQNIHEINSDGIKSTVRGRLEQEKSNYPTKASGLRSKLVRDYPTTLAITTAYKNKDGSHTVNSYWAGDSRNYLWKPEGFYQISKDDLDTELDPLENIKNDGALSNCVCADREFEINNKQIDVTGKFVILSATDGCFNYFASPMHFQEVLSTGLKLSEEQDVWINYCKEEISAVTGDDVSLSLLAIGFEDFQDLKDTFEHSDIANIEDIKSIQLGIKSLSKKIEESKEILEDLVKAGWNEYRVSYLKYFSSESNDNAVIEKNADEGSKAYTIETSAETENSNEADIKAEGQTDEVLESISLPSDNNIVAFFKMTSFDDALTFFRDKIENHGLPENLLSTAKDFLEKLKK